IRDRNVTGVQTCALPISVVISAQEMTIIDTTDMGAGGPLSLTIPSFKATEPLIRQLGDVLRAHSGTTDVNIKLVGNLTMEVMRRSEERRVGKRVSGGWRT